MTKLRVNHLDKSLQWVTREDGKLEESEPDMKLDFVRNLLEFEKHFIDKVVPTT